MNQESNSKYRKKYKKIMKRFKNDMDHIMRFANALNSLPKLDNTENFLSKLGELSSIKKIKKEIKEEKEKEKDDNDWMLIFIDGDDVELLLNNNEKANEAQLAEAMENVQFGIRLLETSIYRLVYDNKNKLFGYHLGGDLFSLLIYDNIENSISIVEKLMSTMRSDESPFTISVGIGKRNVDSIKTAQVSGDVNDNDNDNEKQKDVIKNRKIIQREWSIRAHINLLRAKENGKNCCFSNQVCYKLIRILW